MIEFKALDKEGLEYFINYQEFGNLKNLPISFHRAVSHINNPRAEKNDTLLLLAYFDDDLCGYLGAIPDKLYRSKYDYSKCAWLSCIWVNDQYRGKGIANQLLTEMYNLWDSKLLMTNFTDTAKRLYDKSGYFEDTIDYQGIRGYLRFNLHQLLPGKNPKYNKIKWLLFLFDISANLVNNLHLLYLQGLGRIDDLKVERIEEIDKEIEDLILEKSITCRGREELNWIIQFPWLKIGDPDSTEAKKYAFSSFSKDFELLNLKIRNKEGQLMGFLMLHIRDKQMKIPYAVVNDKEAIIRVIYHYMMKRRIRTLTIFNKELVNYIKTHPSPFIKIRRMLRQYLVTKKLAFEFENIDDLEFQDGDGDSVFT